MEEIFPAGLPTNIQYHIGAEQNHAFRIAPLCPSSSGSNFEYSEQTRDIVRDWLLENLVLSNE